MNNNNNLKLTLLAANSICCGLMTIGVLAYRPTPTCTTIKTESGQQQLLASIDYGASGFGAGISALSLVGFGGLTIWQQLKKQMEKGENETDGRVNVLAPGNTQLADFTTAPDYEYVEAGQVQQQPMVFNLEKTDTATASKSTKPVRDIIQELASSHQSTVIVSEPGCGKSTLEKAVLASLLKTFEDVDIYIAGKKNDNWLGLANNKDRFCFVTKDSLPEFVEMMEEVQNELTRRLGTPEESRDFNKQPLVLLLDDWHALCKGLTKENKEKVTQILGEILTTGREVFVVAHVITQSFNVTSLGLDDANIRGSMNLIALMKSNKDDNGRNDGGIGTATRMINNPTIVGDNNQRQILLDQLPKYIKQTELTSIPAMVCLMGTSPSIEMLPDLNWVKQVKVNIINKQSEKQPEPVPVETTFDKSEVVEKLNKVLSLDVPDDLDQMRDIDIYNKVKHHAESNQKSLYYIITKIFNQPSGGNAFVKLQTRIKRLEERFGPINYPSKNNNN